MKRTTIKKPQGESLSWKAVILVVCLGTLATVWGAILMPAGAQAEPGSQETQGNPQVRIDIEELRVELNDRIDVMESNLSSQLTDLSTQMTAFEATVSGGIAAHDTNIDGDLVAHDANIDGDLVAHDTNIDGDLVAHDTNIDADLAAGTEMVRATHLIDPFDMQVSMCANVSSDADFDATTHFESDFAYGPGIGVDAYGNGAQIDYMVQFDNGLYADVGAQTGVGMTACFNGIYIREDGTVEGLSTTAGTDFQTYLTDNLANQADLVALRQEILDLSNDLTKPIAVNTLTNSLDGLANIEMKVENPFQIMDSSMHELTKELPFTNTNEHDWPNSPIPAMFIDLNPVTLICSPAVTNVFNSVPNNPIAAICANNFGDLVAPMENAFRTLIPEIERVVDDIEDVVDDIDDVAGEIAAFLGID